MSAQAQQECIDKKTRDEINSKACKMGSLLFKQELDKKERGEPSKSIHDVIADVRKEFGTAHSESSIARTSVKIELDSQCRSFVSRASSIHLITV